jgi:hypothetical protein
MDFEYRREQEIFFFSKLSRPALGSTRPPVQWVPGSSPDVHKPRRDIDYSTTSSAELKMAELISTPLLATMS